MGVVLAVCLKDMFLEGVGVWVLGALGVLGTVWGSGLHVGVLRSDCSVLFRGHWVPGLRKYVFAVYGASANNLADFLLEVQDLRLLGLQERCASSIKDRRRQLVGAKSPGCDRGSADRTTDGCRTE